MKDECTMNMKHTNLNYFVHILYMKIRKWSNGNEKMSRWEREKKKCHKIDAKFNLNQRWCSFTLYMFILNVSILFNLFSAAQTHIHIHKTFSFKIYSIMKRKIFANEWIECQYHNKIIAVWKWLKCHFIKSSNFLLFE